MKNKPTSKALLNSCLLTTISFLPWLSSASAQTTEGIFSKLNVGDTTGSTTGDGTIVAEGKYSVSPILPSAFQTAGTRMLWYPRKAAFRAGYGSTNHWSEAAMGQYSTAFGHNNTASSYFSTALGHNNTASGYSSIALGHTNTASNYHSTAIGSINTVSGWSATAIGEGNILSGDYTTAMGAYNVASSWAETVIGFNNAIRSGGDLWDWNPNDPALQIGNGHWGVSESYLQIDLNGDGDMLDNIPETYSNALTVYKNGNMELQGDLTLGGTITSGGETVLTASSASSSFMAANPSSIQGYGSTVSGGGVLALGEGSATGWYSVAIGEYTSAVGYTSFAIGSGFADGDFSVATGGGYTVGDYSVAFSGYAAGDYSVALGGWWTTADGDYSIAMGYAAWAEGDKTFAAGNAHAKGDYSVSMVSGTAEGEHSVAIGKGVKSTSHASAAFGVHNKAWGTTDTYVDEDPILLIGNGTGYSDTLRSNAMEVLKNGKTTLINKEWKTAIDADPSTALDNPPSATDSDGEALVVDGHTRLRGQVIIEQPQGDISMGIYQ